MIVGLGNPGPQYAANRHNVGAQVLELLARRWSIPLEKLQLRGLTGLGWAQRGAARQKLLLVKPLTYMNASGEAVAPLLRFFKVDLADLLVIADDLDLAAGKLRLRPNGSSGGQNGVRSIIDRLGSQEFARLKIGIGRPPGRMDPADYVLQNFSAAEEETFGVVRTRAADAAESWLFDGVEAAMNKFNG
jgi:PTH1 family peptidyl-tRNA hydrolase